MRKILIALLLVGLLVLFGGIVYSGITVGNVNLGYSIPQIMKKNAEIDRQIAALSTEISTNYSPLGCVLPQRTTPCKCQLVCPLCHPD